MIKFCIKYLFADGSELISSTTYDSLMEANHHGESMMNFDSWNSSDCQIIRFVVGTCEFVF